MSNNDPKWAFSVVQKYLLIVLIFTLVSFFGCAPKVEINLNINQTYEKNLGSIGDEQALEIVKQAQNSEISEIIWNKKTYEHIFRYKPMNNYIGKDTVVIELSEYSYDSEKVVLRARYTFNFHIKK